MCAQAVTGNWFGVARNYSPAASYRKDVPPQVVDATPSNQLIR
jgi:hypothetical protein